MTLLSETRPFVEFSPLPLYFQMAASFTTGQSNQTHAHLPLLKALLLTLHGKKKKKIKWKVLFQNKDHSGKKPHHPCISSRFISQLVSHSFKSILTVQSLKEVTQLGANRVRTTRTPSRLSSGEHTCRAEVLIAHLSAWINWACPKTCPKHNHWLPSPWHRNISSAPMRREAPKAINAAGESPFSLIPI